MVNGSYHARTHARTHACHTRARTRTRTFHCHYVHNYSLHLFIEQPIRFQLHKQYILLFLKIKLVNVVRSLLQSPLTQLILVYVDARTVLLCIIGLLRLPLANQSRSPALTTRASERGYRMLTTHPTVTSLLGTSTHAPSRAETIPDSGE